MLFRSKVVFVSILILFSFGPVFSAPGGSKKDACKKLKFVERLNQGNHEIKTIVGADFKFDCRVLGTPEPNITWTKDDKPLRDVSYRSFGSAILEKVFVLKLKNLLLADGGRYKCTADNGECKTITTSWKLIVKENSQTNAPRIDRFYPSSRKLEVGESVTLFCSVNTTNNDDYFTPFIKWERYRKYKRTTQPPIMSNSTNTTTARTALTTSLSTTVSPDEKTLSIGRLTSSRTVIDGIVHERSDVKLEMCQRSEYVIPKVALADAAEYSCVAFNSVGFDKLTSYIEVVPVPPLSKEELEDIYIRKYSRATKLPFSLAAVVVIPVCLIIILIIGCIWWHSNEERLEEKKAKMEKMEKTFYAFKAEEKKAEHHVPLYSAM